MTDDLKKTIHEIALEPAVFGHNYANEPLAIMTREGGDIIAQEVDRRWASLFLAAPDLLAVCIAVVEQDGFRGSALMRKRINEMKAAIEKAKVKL